MLFFQIADIKKNESHEMSKISTAREESCKKLIHHIIYSSEVS